VIAVVVVIVLGVIGFRGLTQNPVGPTVNGVTTLTGNFEPYDDCGNGCVDGYVEAGGRDVFVRLPQGCDEPGRNSPIVVHGRLDTTLGPGSYRATGCATSN
jgi:hypothetical protein